MSLVVDRSVASGVGICFSHFKNKTDLTKAFGGSLIVSLEFPFLRLSVLPHVMVSVPLRNDAKIVAQVPTVFSFHRQFAQYVLLSEKIS